MTVKKTFKSSEPKISEMQMFYMAVELIRVDPKKNIVVACEEVKKALTTLRAE